MNYNTNKSDKGSAFTVSGMTVLKQFILFIVIVASILVIAYAPKLKDNPNPTELREQFFAEYGRFYEAYRAMEHRGFLAANLNRTPSFGRKFGGFFDLESLCEDYFDTCLWNNLTYKTLDGEIIPAYLGSPNVGQFRTKSGALYLLYSYGNEMWIFVDVNGIKKLPNRFGFDIFAFYIGDEDLSLKLMGAEGTPFQTMNLYCNPYTSNKYNGMSCPIKAILDKDFFIDMHKILYK